MRCPKCDAKVKDDATLCSFCGQDLTVIRYVCRVSNTYYNMGLEKAEVRDLSGAIEVLEKSLHFNKHNTNARNLLGLIYYEMGETVAALSQWILSKYMQPEDNLADYYIDTVQKNQTALDATNQTIKKYNSALAAAQIGNEDLALIQLKKVVNTNPHFVRALQLLSLLYIHEEDYQKAAKYLNRARRIDFNNTTTLRYMQEVGERAGGGATRPARTETVKNQKRSSKKDPLSNVTPVGTYKEEKKSLLPPVYIIIGAIIGVAISFILLRPTILKSSNDTGSQLSDANDQLTVQESQISSLETEKTDLQSQVEDLQKQIDDADTQAQQQSGNYEKLIKGLDAYMDGETTQAAIEVADCSEDDFATQEAKDLYTKISTVTEIQITELYEEGKTMMYSSYDSAIKIFKNVLKLDEDHQGAMYQIGYCYQRQEKYNKAKSWYEKAINVDSSTEIATEAQTHLDEVNESLGTTATAEATATATTSTTE